MKLSKDKRDKLILVILGAVGLAIGLWYAVIGTRKTALADSIVQLQRAEDKLVRARNWVKDADKISRETEVIEKELRETERGFASGEDLYSWSYLLLQKAGEGHEVDIVDVTRPQEKSVLLLPDFPYRGAVFSVRGIADYHAFGKFLADFENRFPYFRVQNVSVGTTAEAGPEVTNARMGKEKIFFRVEIVALVKPNAS